MTDTTQAASPTPPPGVAVRLRPPAHRIERRSIGWWVAQGAILAVVVVGGLGAAYAVLESARPWLGPALVIAAVGIPIIGLVQPLLRYHVHRWETTDEAVYALSGWFFREWRIAPISRIQTVDTERGPLQRAFGLATLRVTTASASGAIEIAGLDHVTAAEAAERLTEITRHTQGDAT